MRSVLVIGALASAIAPLLVMAQSNDAASEQARFRTAYGRCLYARQQAEAERFIQHSDAGGIDSAVLGNERLVASRWRPQQCLDVGLNALSTRRLPDRLAAGVDDLRPMLLEAAYVARFKAGPDWIGGKAATASRAYVSKDKDLARAQAADDFADCVVAAAPQASDALIRSEGGSTEERTAVRSLAPSLGPCLSKDQSLKMTATDLRRLLVEGLWTASGAAAKKPGRPAPIRAS